VKETPRLKLIASRESSQRHLMEELQRILQSDDECDVVVLLAYDDGDHGVLTSAISKSQLVYMLEEAKHDALCGSYDAETDGPLVPEAS
jgi:hypothetical protein